MFRFPWGDMHSLNLGWFLQKFNELRADWATAEENITGALDAEIQRAEDALSDVFNARDAAAASATAAAGSASAAGTSATAAQNSATGAASSATLANQKATAAGLSEAAAAQSATQAGNSATAAAGSATQAGQSATNAAGSATAAGNSASAAASSETNAAASAAAAAASETNAAASAAAAAASEAAAEAVEQSIPEDYTALSNKVNNNPLFYLYPSIYSPAIRIGSGAKINAVFNKNIVVITGTVVRTRLIDTLRDDTGAIDPTHTIYIPGGTYKATVIILEKNITASDENGRVYIDMSLSGDSFNRFIITSTTGVDLPVNTPLVSNTLAIQEGYYDITLYVEANTFTTSSFTMAFVIEKV